MLAEFHLQNFVLLEDARLAFRPGFNVISGETGAGKSLVASALGVVLGRERFSSAQIRKGAEQCSLTAVFELSAPELKRLGRELGLDLSAAADEGLIIERTFAESGRGRAAVCGQPVPVATIARLGEMLCDITAQDEHGALRDPAVQGELLDRFAACEKERERAGAAYRLLRELVDRIRGGRRLREERRRELEFVRHDIEEIDNLSPHADKDARIDGEIAVLANATRILEFCSSSVSSLYEADDAAVATLGRALREAERLGGEVSALRPAAEQLARALEELEGAVASIRDVADTVEADPSRLDTLEIRRQKLLDCSRKHNCEIPELGNILEKLRLREQELSSLDEDEDALIPKAVAAAKDFIATALALRALREKGGAKLAKEVKRHLANLGMAGADFAVQLRPLCGENADYGDLADKASAQGLDEVAFALKANPGENWGDLASTASGGETARALLSVKSALVKANPCGTLFFDEIDAGVGGRMGEAVASQFELLARERQVVAITHLPQIAARGETHLRLVKKQEKGRTRTVAEPLSGDERVREIACMIRGENSTATTLKQAREMLAAPLPGN